MSSDKLALHGGAPVIRSRRPLHLQRLREGVRRSLDLLGLLPLTIRNVTSIADRSGFMGRFESEFAKLAGTRFALAMNSGTASLHSAYFATGVGPGSEVIVPSYTWHASATPILQCRAVPVFCEIDPRTLTIDVADAERCITQRTRAICVVHTWGNPAPMDRVMELADRHSLAVIEDCSHAHGARWRDRSVGSFGQVGCFSLQGSKAVEGGEAGVAVTNDPVLYDRMLLLGHNALVAREQQADSFPGFGDVSLGVKYRPHPAAINFASRSLNRLPERNRRAALAWRWLCEELAETSTIRPIEIPEGGERGGWYAFVFEYRGEALGGPNTEAFVEAVRAEGVPIDTDQFRGRLLHQQPLFTELDRRQLGGGCFDPTRPWEENLCRQRLPVTEAVTERLVRLAPQLWGLSESFVRSCGRAMCKVSQALVPAPNEAGAATELRASAKSA